MKNTEYYIKRLQSTIQENDKKSKDILERCKEVLDYSTDSYFAAYERNDWNRMQELLESERELRKTLTKKLNEFPSETAVMASKIVQTYNIFNKIFQIELEKETIKHEIRFIEQQYKYARKILAYLYNKDYVRHKELHEILKIPKSSLTDTLQALEEAEIIGKIKAGKCSFYDLTNEGREYIKKYYDQPGEEYGNNKEKDAEKAGENIELDWKQKMKKMELSNWQTSGKIYKRPDERIILENEKKYQMCVYNGVRV